MKSVIFLFALLITTFSSSAQARKQEKIDLIRVATEEIKAKTVISNEKDTESTLTVVDISSQAKGLRVYIIETRPLIWSTNDKVLLSDISTRRLDDMLSNAIWIAH